MLHLNFRLWFFETNRTAIDSIVTIGKIGKGTSYGLFNWQAFFGNFFKNEKKEFYILKPANGLGVCFLQRYSLS